jgi:hypothetical protein
VTWTARAAALQLAAAALVVPLSAQSAHRTPGDSLDVALLTIGPGAEVWEKFGHNALVIVDRATGRATSYNYGMFDFRQESFVLRFVQGRMWYYMLGRAAQRDMDLYTRDDRSVWLQQLAMMPAQKEALRDFLVRNDTDELRHYHYDYYRDNCSTRVRDALDRALGGAIAARFDTAVTPSSYRWHTARLTSGSPLLYTGLMLALGHPTDQPLTAWERMFLPVHLMQDLRELTVPDSAGHPVPLVFVEQQVHQSTRYPEPEAPRRFVFPFLVVGLLLGSLLWITGAGGSRAGHRMFTVLGVSWSVVAGVGGVVLLGLWLLTDHVAARGNASVLLLSPLSLALVLLLPLSLRGRARAGRAALGAALLVAALAGFAIVTLAWPGLRQPNPELLALTLPLHAGLLAGVASMVRTRPSP